MLQYERSNAQVFRSHAEFILTIRRIRNERERSCGPVCGPQLREVHAACHEARYKLLTAVLSSNASNICTPVSVARTVYMTDVVYP